MLNRLLKIILPLVVIGLALVSSYALVVNKPIQEKIPSREIATQIRTLTVAPRRIQLMVKSQGTVIPRVQSELVPEVSGKVRWVSPNLINGGYFAEGEILLRIDDRDYRNTVDRRNTAIDRAKAEYQHARFELRRMQQLVKNRLTSQSQLETALRTARITQASLREAEIALQQAQRELQRTELKAPFAGLVSSERVDLGQFVSRGQSIASLHATDVVEVRLPLADSQLAFLDLPLGLLGEMSQLQAPEVLLSTYYRGEHHEWTGHLVRKEAEIDSRSRMVNVIARVSNQDNHQMSPLPIGLFVNAEIAGLWVDDVVELPRSAFRNNNQVLIVDAENRLWFRSVELLKIEQDQVLIKTGLDAGERVNISPLQVIVEGMQVNPIQVEEG